MVSSGQIVGYLESPDLSRRELVRKPRKPASSVRKRADGRTQLLIYLSPDIIRELKFAALSQDRPAYELAEKAIGQYLKKVKRRSKS